ncbi:hypothetical protein PVAP13_7KG415940 [Panicum virgatum]|uniref:Uncharacterized protein n=1 Tax=Panicum virgatum TaxID=38727 RepID=A0A8T0QQG1_PANVG|nr:hypothetical protein PVAP13_7KG415940 [Panicum virgatum]
MSARLKTNEGVWATGPVTWATAWASLKAERARSPLDPSLLARWHWHEHFSSSTAGRLEKHGRALAPSPPAQQVGKHCREQQQPSASSSTSRHGRERRRSSPSSAHGARPVAAGRQLCLLRQGSRRAAACSSCGRRTVGRGGASAHIFSFFCYIFFSFKKYFFLFLAKFCLKLFFC